MIKNATTGDMRTLAECHAKLMAQGFVEDFKASESGLLSLKKEQIYQPEEVAEVNFYRFEGASDPADNSILYAIVTEDGTKGTLVDAYGPYADERVEKFIQQVESLHKKPVHHDSKSD